MGPSWTQLEAQKQLLLARSLAPNSINTYRTGINQYLRFCGNFGIRPLPLSEKVLENFCVSLCHRISHKSIKVYLCGVQYLSKINGYRSLIEHMLRLDYVIKAIRRFQGNKFNRPARPLSHGKCYVKFVRSWLPQNSHSTGTCLSQRYC